MLHPLVGLQALDRRHLTRVCYLLIVALLGSMLALPAQAEGPSFLVKNINTLPDPSPSSYPANLVAVGNTVYFDATVKGVHGLWKSDGTAAGTTLVKQTAASLLSGLNGMLFFSAYNETTGRNGLWKSDGTAAGTTLVKDISPSEVATLNNLLFFVAADPVSSVAGLWKSDGTAAGTTLIKTISASKLTNVNGTLFFVAATSGAPQIWKSDGTAAGTVPVSTSGQLHQPANLIAANGTLFFTDVSADGHAQLWKSTATPAGTLLLKQFESLLAPQQVLTKLTNVNGTLFFSACVGTATCHNALWKSNGTAAGTVLVKDISPLLMHSSGGKLFFFANPTTASTDGLWVSDGTTAGTVLVKEITPASNPFLSALSDVNGTLFFTTETQLWKSDGTAAGTAPIFSSADLFLDDGFLSQELVNANGRLFFPARSNVGVELWKSDGTTPSTALVKDINEPADLGSYPQQLTNLNGKLIFVVDDGTHGAALWRSDGTTAGTTLLKAFGLGTAPGDLSVRAVIGQTLFFTFRGKELWKSDGTTAGTTLVKAFGVNTTIGSSAQLGQALFFTINDEELWKSNGTSAGTTLVRKFTPSSGDSAISIEIALNGILYFTVSTDTTVELWRTNGTTTGTLLLQAFNKFSSNPNVRYTFLTNFTIVEGRLFFVYVYAPQLPDQSTHVCCTPVSELFGLWTSDGTHAGTIFADALFDVALGDFYPPAPISLNGSFFFAGKRNQTYGLWKSNGTISSTSLLKQTGIIKQIVNINERLFFRVEFPDPNDGYRVKTELWTSDGTAAGTTLIKNLPGFSITSALINVHGRMFFTAIEGASFRRELWTSDGTTAGTRLLKAIGPINDSPIYLSSVGRKLFVIIENDEFGQNLWQSDGTSAGTTLVQTLTPPRTGLLGLPAVAGAYVFFVADDQTHGQELWAMRGDVDTFVQSPALAGAPPSSPAAVSIQYGNIGIASASALTLTATLHPALTYIGDTSGISPTISGQTLTWRITGASLVSGRSFTLSVRTPNAAYGTTYPIALALAVAGQESYPADNTTTIQVMIARQVYLPFASR
jgi:ELWxxDGT repeat protein